MVARKMFRFCRKTRDNSVISSLSFNDNDYSYDADGMRTRKSTSLNTHEYLTQNGKVVRETIDDGTTTKVLDFIYDEAGRPFALRYSTNGGASFITYYYVLNFQGDVVKLVRIYAGTTIQEYEEVANYTYNAWGEILEASGTMAEINPLRYRGYYYDSETGFYYLQSRYYDPANHRFINADVVTNTGQGFLGNNMFAYCLNCPVIFADNHGQDAVLVINEEMAFGNGHVSLFVQDKTGTWHYFSFSTARRYSITIVAGIFWRGNKGYIHHEVVGRSDKYELNTFESFKKFLLSSNEVNVTASGMDYAYYFEGDFSATYEHANKRYEKQNTRYNLFSYNCMHFAIDMLTKSWGEDFPMHEALDLLFLAYDYSKPNSIHQQFGEYGVMLK